MYLGPKLMMYSIVSRFEKVSEWFNYTEAHTYIVHDIIQWSHMSQYYRITLLQPTGS